MDQSFIDNTINTISNGRIDSIERDGNTTLLTVSYTNCFRCQRRNDTIRLAIGKNTLLLDENGNRMASGQLTKGMVINAVLSSAMTRSIPPQANAFTIQVVSRPTSENTITGRILDINKNNRSFTTIQGKNLSSLIQFHVSPGTKFIDILGRPASFQNLFPGLRVRVTHAPFMTASIPPQTTAYEVQVIRS